MIKPSSQENGRGVPQELIILEAATAGPSQFPYHHMTRRNGAHRSQSVRTGLKA
jgi:hypothetical protein